MSSPSTSTEIANCHVCSQPAHGNHFGAISCRACAAFFRRSLNGKSTAFECWIGDGKCRVKRNGKFNCKKCRLDRCFEAGMKAEKLQHGRDLISSTHNFVVAKQRKMLSQIPLSLQRFLGRPHFILSCEPDLATSKPTLIDFKFLIDHALDLFEYPTSNHPLFPNSTSLLNKLSYGLKETRRSTNDAMKMCKKVGKNECLLFWEHEFMTVAKWLTYCDAFQQLPRSMKIQFLKSTWYMWMRLERIALTVETLQKDSSKCKMSDSICIDFKDFDIDVSWFTRYRKEQVIYFVDPLECLYLPHIVEPLQKLAPSMQEMTYMLCLLSFRHGGKHLGGEIQKLGDRLIENLANDLHNYYVNDLKIMNYAGRMTKMMQIVQFVEKDIYERLERLNIAKTFEIFSIEFSHPEMFYGYR